MIDVMLFAASLRVYEPLAAFSGAERAHWDGYVAAGAHVPLSAGSALERGVALQALAGRPPRLPTLTDHAHVLEVDGVTLICPWRTAVRSQEALLDFCADLSDLMAEAYAPGELLAQAEVELDRWRAEHGTTTTHIRTCTWQVPLRWFLLVDADERVVSLGAPAGAAGAVMGRRTGRSLLYRTPMSRARRRTARALAVLRRTLDDPSVVEGLVELGRWLEEFHPRSLVELDYGDLVHLLEDAELHQDESARDISQAMALLADGDGQAAAASYGRVLARMKALQAVESAN